MENTKGFDEARINQKTGKKIKFFYLGSKNDYTNILDAKLVNKINSSFKNDLESNDYF